MVNVMGKKISIMGIVLFLILISFTIYKVLESPLKLIDDDIIELSLGEKYKEPGYKAHSFFKNLNENVIVTNNINKDKLGTYTVTYKLEYGDQKYLKTRKVKVIDKEKPQIILKGNKTSFVCPNSAYSEDGYTAIDNYDGNITENVKVKKESNRIIYSVSDKSGNKAETIRTLKKGDKTPPKITLGQEEVKVSIGSPYYEGDYGATDNCDGDLSKSVKYEGHVDTSKEGTYTIKYTVNDKSGNIGTARKKIIVGKFAMRTIYLTFDDGPSRLTEKFLDVLKEKNVKATFFVIGPKIDALSHIVKREYDEGHAIGLHSFSHDYRKVYQSEENFWNDLQKIREKVYNITGKYSNIIRFPGGSSNSISRRYKRGIMTNLSKQVASHGYTYFDWNVSSGDAGDTKNPDKIYKNVVSNLHNGANVILMHDVDANNGSLTALSKIIDYGKKNGFNFEKLTETTAPLHHTINN